MDVRDGPVLVLQRIRTLLETLITDEQIDRLSIRGMGIGIPGPVEFRSGEPVSPPIMPGWHRFRVRAFFENAYACPVYVDNDVNVLALGERWAGLGQGFNDSLFVKVGTGIGCGIISGGRIYRGADGSAGDIGHISVTDDDVVCRCGNVGCLEAVAGGAALSRIAQEAAQRKKSTALREMLKERGELSASDLSGAIERGDPVATRIIREAGARIGRTLAGLVNFYNPQLIVLGGGVVQTGNLFLASIREAVYRRSLPLATAHLVIQESVLGDRAGVIGAAAMVLEELLHIDPLNAQGKFGARAYGVFDTETRSQESYTA